MQKDCVFQQPALLFEKSSRKTPTEMILCFQFNGKKFGFCFRSELCRSRQAACAAGLDCHFLPPSPLLSKGGYKSVLGHPNHFARAHSTAVRCELERLSNLVGKPSENHPLHNSGLLSLDPVQDKTPLYSQLLQAYKWSNKLQYHAGLASGLLNQQSLKRSANQMGVSAKRRPKAQPTTLVLPPQYVDDVISRIDRMFPEMSIQLSRPNGTSAMLLVTLGKVLKVIVVMRSLFIDRTIVKGYNENVYTEDGKLDIWSKSNYQVFQKVTDHATTALLHYQLPQMPDVVVRSFMTWLRSYIKLFQAPCQRCGKFLQDGLPPTWRDFRTLEAFHDTCRQ
nr:PREDICTED: mediator of RNA polymerase II transcription subunit 27 [Struthio camelus australis]